MKTHDLRTTVLILAGTLALAFLLSFWWMSRQARLLRDIQSEIATRTEDLVRLKAEALTEQKKADLFRAQMGALDQQIRMDPQKHNGGTLLLLKRGFNDIQHHVAKGEFAGLALTDGYMELREIFDNPAFEEMLARDHGANPR